MKPIVVSVLFFVTVAMSAQAEEALSVTPEQTWDTVQEQGDNLLFIDVRDPVEIMFIGFTDAGGPKHSVPAGGSYALER